MVRSVPLENFLAQGLMEAQSLLVLDLSKCTRCDACVTACADSHDGVTRLVREGLRFENFLVATSCRQCRDPLCMVGCPVGAIRRRNSLEVIIEDWCIGCGLCAKNCPYGNINMHSFAAQAAAQEGQPKLTTSMGTKESRCAEKGHHLRPLHRPCRAQLRLRLPARCRASRRAARFLRRDARTARGKNGEGTNMIREAGLNVTWRMQLMIGFRPHVNVGVGLVAPASRRRFSATTPLRTRRRDAGATNALGNDSCVLIAHTRAGWSPRSPFLACRCCSTPFIASRRRRDRWAARHWGWHLAA